MPIRVLLWVTATYGKYLANDEAENMFILYSAGTPFLSSKRIFNLLVHRAIPPQIALTGAPECFAGKQMRDSFR